MGEAAGSHWFRRTSSTARGVVGDNGGTTNHAVPMKPTMLNIAAAVVRANKVSVINTET